MQTNEAMGPVPDAIGHGAPDRRTPPLRLNERVLVMVIHAGSIERASGTIVGRTFEEHPRFDVRLDGGRRIGNVGREQIVRGGGETQL